MKGMGSEEAGARGRLAVPRCTWQGRSAASVGVETGLARAVKPFQIGAPGRDLIKLENYGKRTVLPLWWVCSAGSQGSAPSCNQVRVSAARSSWQSPSLLVFPLVTRQFSLRFASRPQKAPGIRLFGNYLLACSHLQSIGPVCFPVNSIMLFFSFDSDICNTGL